MRVGLVRLFAVALMLCAPGFVMAAAQGTSQSSSQSAVKAPAKPAVKKAAVKKAPEERAANAKPAPRYKAPIYTAIIIDAATGQVLSEVNADTQGYPASLTKMMTLYMLFEALNRGEVTLDTVLPVSTRATQAAPSKLGLTRTSKLTVEQAIGALITKSANDVAVVTAEKLGGTEDKFAEMMTARARQLGMSKTTFKNAHGLPNPNQFSTARDMSVLATRLIRDFPQYYPQFSRMEFAYQGQSIRSHNRLLEFYEGADGIKTGFTSASGFNLVASATRNGYRVIGVMFGGTSAGARDRKLAGMMDQGFAVLSGAPATLIARNNAVPNSDPIGTQIAQAEEGDRDQPFTPVTQTGSRIETSALPPLSQSPVTASIPARDEAALGTWGVQIGAFSARARAEAQVSAATVSLKRTFAGVTPLVIPVKVNGKMIYRARIMGLAKDDLLRACATIPVQVKAGGCQAVAPDAKRVAAR
jgi:D-alanyl-D-alanine carboxypeptidase